MADEKVGLKNSPDVPGVERYLACQLVLGPDPAGHQLILVWNKMGRHLVLKRDQFGHQLIFEQDKVCVCQLVLDWNWVWLDRCRIWYSETRNRFSS